MSKRKMIALLVLILLSSIPTASSAGSWNGWIYQDPYPTSVNLFDVKFITPMKGWITGKYGTILYTEDGGETWEAQESSIEEDIMRVAFVNEKTGWAAGERGPIIHTMDGGKTWVKQYNINALPTKIFFLNEKEGWVTGATPMGVVFYTKDSGKTWQKVDTGINRAIGSVYFLNSQTGWILAGEEVYRTADGGKKWEKSMLPITEQSMPQPLGRYPGGRPAMNPMGEGLGSEWWYGDIAFANEKQGWAAVFHWIFHTDDGGKTWAVQRDTGNLSVGHISFRDTKNGCVSGGTIYCTEDGGKTWQERLGLGPREDEMLGGVSLTGQSGGWTVGNGGRIWETEDSGRSWKKALTWNTCGPAPFFINKKTGWLYEPRDFNSVCRTDDGGHTWKKQEIGIKVMDVFFINDLTGWAVGLREEWKDGKETTYSGDVIKTWGVIKHTTDGGKTWKTQYKESIGKEGNSSLTRLFFINREIGWVVGTKGTILYTADGGKHWERQQGEDAELYLDRVQLIDAKTVWITGARVHDGWTGIILHTEDGGKHWKVQYRLKDVWFSDLDFTDKTSGWAIGETEYGEIGVLLHTEDGGKTWSKKIFESVGHVYLAFLDKQRGVIYSLNGFIFATTDGGKTWNRRRVPLKKYPWHFSEIFEKDKR